MISVDATHPLPPFEQIRVQIADQIRSGALVAGQRLPSIRQLAGDLRVATGTVAKAYADLEASGLISSSRARGTIVRADQGLGAGLLHAAKEFVDAARQESLTLQDALGAIRSEWDRQSQAGPDSRTG